jgi:hypothetical protein
VKGDPTLQHAAARPCQSTRAANFRGPNFEQAHPLPAALKMGVICTEIRPKTVQLRPPLGSRAPLTGKRRPPRVNSIPARLQVQPPAVPIPQVGVAAHLPSRRWLIAGRLHPASTQQATPTAVKQCIMRDGILGGAAGCQVLQGIVSCRLESGAQYMSRRTGAESSNHTAQCPPSKHDHHQHQGCSTVVSRSRAAPGRGMYIHVAYTPRKRREHAEQPLPPTMIARGWFTAA